MKDVDPLGKFNDSFLNIKFDVNTLNKYSKKNFFDLKIIF